VSPPLVVGTAGHVDHGKTSLVRALTGRDTDRLAEEKARGISIELGFASLTLPSGRVMSLVDVPGHERFVRHMVAGASGVDGYLLCVAADDGMMPQTREHLAVLDLLGVRAGVVALTKTDLLDPELAILEVRGALGDGPEIVPVSVVTGDGLDELVGALERLAAGIVRRVGEGRARLFVDRAFSVAGAGTVVTGTLWGGGVAVGDRVVAHPGGAAARVRGAQVHDRAVDQAPGGRVALNLAGVERACVPRGSCVVRADDGWRPSALLDVALTWLSDAGAPLRTRRRLQAFLGTAEVPASCVLLEGEELAPGAVGYAQLRLERPVPAEAGDRVVLRSAERRTVGGARVVDAHPQRHGRGSPAAARLAVLERGDPAELGALRLAEAGAAGLRVESEAAEVLRAAGAVVLPGGWALEPDRAARARKAVVAAVGGGPITRAAARAACGLAGKSAEALVQTLVEEGVLIPQGARLALPGADASDPAAEAVGDILAAAGLRPPGETELAERAGVEAARLPALLAGLREAGRAVRGGDLWFDARAAGAARDAAAAALAAGPMRIGELRDLWGVGRRHALALAAYLDATGLTRRLDGRRVLRRSHGG